MIANEFRDLNYPELSAIDNKLGKIPALQHTEYSSEIKVSENEIDINGHVNNVWYADWIMKTLPVSISKNKKLTSFEINYLSEVFVNEIIKIEMGPSDNSKDTILGLLKKDEKEVCRVIFSFE